MGGSVKMFDFPPETYAHKLRNAASEIGCAQRSDERNFAVAKGVQLLLEMAAKMLDENTLLEK